MRRKGKTGRKDKKDKKDTRFFFSWDLKNLASTNNSGKAI